MQYVSGDIVEHGNEYVVVIQQNGNLVWFYSDDCVYSSDVKMLGKKIANEDLGLKNIHQRYNTDHFADIEKLIEHKTYEEVVAVAKSSSFHDKIEEIEKSIRFHKIMLITGLVARITPEQEKEWSSLISKHL